MSDNVQQTGQEFLKPGQVEKDKNARDFIVGKGDKHKPHHQ
jgi:hypothetical protein